MTAVTARKRDVKRDRQLITPEGIALPLSIASRGARAGALLLDLVLIVTVVFVVLVALLFVTDGAVFATGTAAENPAVELLLVLIILLLFLARFGYFLWFELGPRGATPGKRALGIRVAARPGSGGDGRLTAEAVIARNLMRDMEVFLPATFLLSGQAGMGITGIATFIWLGIFTLFPFFNRDNLRAGDLIAGTWVVEVDKIQLPQAMSVAEDRSQIFHFGEAELAVYGEHELQVLEDVLRANRPEAMRQVMEAICRKIGWEAGAGHEREFLEAFYAALRARLESNMRFGKRKRDKFS
ncbi:putative RDD family membrane protein YckC [Altererythrobacter atlanticus]|uniref:RDD family protein n=1 Tax=Croceibacterium atlanticum TaxID=1267766 RepID=A0A0F7KU15_9SPHN|nr:RDD family protein [Croceibacterium atlanticum]AKH42651.1 RDD family protein [Croceibacterium atlanticum]MBB5731428.1 putative RDD family membrane protein YckC [Croceibacterium atlanticum]